MADEIFKEIAGKLWLIIPVNHDLYQNMIYALDKHESWKDKIEFDFEVEYDGPIDIIRAAIERFEKLNNIEN